MSSIIAVLVIYLCVLFGIGVYFSRKNKNITDFLLAGRNLGLIPAILTLTATLFGGGLLTGTAQYAYESGPMMYVYGITAGLGLFLCVLLVKKMENFSSHATVTEYLEKRFNSKLLRSAAAILSMMALIGILGGQVSAVVGMMNALGFTNTIITTLLAMAVIIALTAMGGMLAVTMTDCFQIILVIIGVIWIFVVSLGNHGGFSGIYDSLAGMTASLPKDYNTFMNGSKFTALTWMILPGIMYTAIGQDIYQRLFACKDHKTSIRTALGAGVMLSLLACIPVALGLMARIDFPELAADGVSSSAFAKLAMSTLPSWAVGIIMAAALSAILSTADSLLSAATSHFMNDFWMCYVDKDTKTSDKKLLWISRTFTVIAGGAAVIISMMIPTILDACFYSYYLFTGGVFAPIVFGVLWKKATREGAIAGLFSGGLFAIFSITGVIYTGGIPAELFSGVISSVVLVAVSLFTQKKHSDEMINA